MKPIKLVVESQLNLDEKNLDGDIFEELLSPELYTAFDVSLARGRSSALSMAVTAMSIRQQAVLLYINAATSDPRLSKQRHQYAQYYLGHGGTSTHYHIITAIPRLEVIFTADKAVLNAIMGREVSDVEWELAQYKPRAFISPDGDPAQFDPHAIIDRLSPDMLARLRQHPYLQAMREFIMAHAPIAG